MSPEELAKLLNLKPKESSARIPSAQAEQKELGKANSSTVYRLDKFDLEQGERLHKVPVIEKSKLTPLDMADLHGACFLPEPERTQGCFDKRREEYLSNLTDSPQYKSLHNYTSLNLAASDLAALEFAQEYDKLKQVDKKREEKPGKKDPEREQLKSEAACIRAASKALDKAQEQVSEYLECCRGIGTGGEGESELDSKRMLEAYHKIKNHPQLRLIFNKAGAFRRFAQACQRKKVSHGADDVVGVEIGGDIARLTSQELSFLSDPELELDTMRRIVENQAMVRKHKGVEKVGKGPIIVCVDESGSMYGEPIVNAKAFALALAWVARHQKRWIGFVSYSGGKEGIRLAMPPNKWDETKLLNWLVHFYGQGTTCDVPLQELPNVYWPEFIAQGMKQGKTDLIVITDGLISVPYDIERNFNTWKKQAQCKSIGLMLNCTNAGGLARVLDEVYPVRSVGLDEVAIERCLSI